jgi:hypothetical protein|tara:strand:+ start:239 stop:529 length:291 start_codon:yes stop_codon:yes gene_type:complete
VVVDLEEVHQQMVVMVVHQVHLETLHLVVEEEVLKHQDQELVELVVAVAEAEASEVAEALDLVILAHLPILILRQMVTLHLMVGEMMVEQTHILVA